MARGLPSSGRHQEAPTGKGGRRRGTLFIRGFTGKKLPLEGMCKRRRGRDARTIYGGKGPRPARQEKQVRRKGRSAMRNHPNEAPKGGGKGASTEEFLFVRRAPLLEARGEGTPPQ